MGYERFGPIGEEIGDYARELIENFSAEPDELGPESHEMPKSDYRALEDWLEIEEAVPLIDVTLDVEGSERRMVHNALFEFNTALPFSEAERGWLNRMYRHLARQSAKEMPQAIECYEDQVMASGVRQVVSGRDLMRRWVAWRRQTDEYEGQGSLDQAVEALRSIETLME
ncbi:MAG: hypothetical protein ACYDHN_11750 [Solirubrobacteraceae bacterium]